MRRGVVVLLLSIVFGMIGTSAFAYGDATVHITKGPGNTYTTTVYRPISKCFYPKVTGEHVICFTMTNDEYLQLGPTEIIWTPSHTEYLYDTKTGKHFLGEDPGTLDQPL